MNILSLFDGISAGRVALERSGIKVVNYYAGEIDKYAMAVTNYRYPDTKQLGDVTEIKGSDLPTIDMLIGGSPCQGFSLAGKQLNFEDPRSKLFFEFVRLLKETNPKYFMLENVKMKKEYQDIISEYLGVQPIEINSALLSAQNRRRLYWVGERYNGRYIQVDINQPQDKGILLRDVLIDGSTTMGAMRGRYVDGNTKTTQQFETRKDAKSNTITSVSKDNLVKIGTAEMRPPSTNSNICYHIADATDINGHDSIKRVYSSDGKSPTLNTMSGGNREPKVLINESSTKDGKAYTITARYSGAVAWNSIERKQRTMIPIEETDDEDCNVYNNVRYRKLTPLECERLQTFDDDYTLVPFNKKMMSNSQRYKQLGNSWTVDVVAHIFNTIKHMEAPRYRGKLGVEKLNYNIVKFESEIFNISKIYTGQFNYNTFLEEIKDGIESFEVSFNPKTHLKINLKNKDNFYSITDKIFNVDVVDYFYDATTLGSLKITRDTNLKGFNEMMAYIIILRY